MKPALQLLRDIRAAKATAPTIRLNDSAVDTLVSASPTGCGAAETTRYSTAGVSVADFATSGRVLTIRSSVLGCDVLFAADNALVHNPRNLVVYRASELTLLGGYDSEALRLLHEIKCISGAPLTTDR